MVNYCCVYACGRNSRVNKHLTYYSLPKGKERREQWLRAAGRDDLLEKALSSSARFCSIHFPPAQIRRKNLTPDAVPSLYIPGSVAHDNLDLEPEKHNGVVCNSCSDGIVGFRYKCMVCHDFDLCQKCEMLEVHPNHLMVRISRRKKIRQADNVINKWHDLLKAEEGISDDNINSDNDNSYQSSDDEPITKYTKAYDGGVDLPDDVKRMIRKEVDRVIKVVKKQNAQKDVAKKRPAESNKTSKRLRTEGPSNMEKTTEDLEDPHLNLEVQELAFADVGDVKLDKIIKCETAVPSGDLQSLVNQMKVYI